MTNPLADMRRLVLPRRTRTRIVGRCPVCQTDVLQDSPTLTLHGLHVHQACASYRMRQRARLG
jgi:hypothetical protein